MAACGNKVLLNSFACRIYLCNLVQRAKVYPNKVCFGINIRVSKSVLDLFTTRLFSNIPPHPSYLTNCEFPSNIRQEFNLIIGIQVGIFTNYYAVTMKYTRCTLHTHTQLPADKTLTNPRKLRS